MYHGKRTRAYLLFSGLARRPLVSVFTHTYTHKYKHKHAHIYIGSTLPSVPHPLTFTLRHPCIASIALTRYILYPLLSFTRFLEKKKFFDVSRSSPVYARSRLTTVTVTYGRDYSAYPKKAAGQRG